MEDGAKVKVEAKAEVQELKPEATPAREANTEPQTSYTTPTPKP